MAGDGAFDARVAATYDRDHGNTDPETIRQTVDVLARLAGGGPVLEFAIGTGRIALPLAQRGLTVKGIELSRPMVDEMRKKPGGDAIDVVIGDMTSAHVPGAFALVALVFNTIDNLTTQEAQVACFENAARHLTPGGRFVVETQVPQVQKLPFGATRLAFAGGGDHWGMDEIDVATQSYASHHIWLRDGAPETLTVPFRYAWPAEMDLMARIAGLEPEHRWGDWDGRAFDRLSEKHVSVWRLAHT